MKKIIILLSSTIIVLLFYLRLTTNDTYAQQVTLSISPPIVETLIKPGKSILIGYTIQNLGDPTPIRIQVRPFTPQGEFGEMTIESEQTSPVNFSLDNTDMEFEKPFLMRQKDIRQALLRIRVPDTIPQGDYYFIVLATTDPLSQTAGGTSSFAKATIGSTLLMTVSQSGFVEMKGRIALFDFIPSFTIQLFGKRYRIVESGSDIPVRLVIQNQGKNLIKPHGEIVLRDGLGNKSAYTLLSQNVLADSQRLIHTDQKKNTSTLYTHVITGYHLGTYSLTTNVNFGENSPQLFASTEFIAIPIRFTVLLGAVILISILLVVLMKKRKAD